MSDTQESAFSFVCFCACAEFGVFVYFFEVFEGAEFSVEVVLGDVGGWGVCGGDSD